ncbi:hypothetical protein K439DRAFT_1656923 [Ramaria rubella]|nr:hypothetical protein K439DRAFT_1656923 [Ramaria rubella]
MSGTVAVLRSALAHELPNTSVPASVFSKIPTPEQVHMTNEGSDMQGGVEHAAITLSKNLPLHRIPASTVRETELPGQIAFPQTSIYKAGAVGDPLKDTRYPLAATCANQNIDSLALLVTTGLGNVSSDQIALLLYASDRHVIRLAWLIPIA